MSFNPDILPELLPIYYKRYFPQNLFCRWLISGSHPQPLENRELSFTLAEDVYLRYLSISNQKELQTMFERKIPYKIDVGAVYNSKPSLTRQSAIVVGRELVFDIDMTDYDEVRTCCQEANVCEKCWKFMILACQILDKALRDDFGFNDIVWVYSGRRGIHCWVSDFYARTLDGPGRSAVADYLCVVSGGENQAKKVILSNDRIHSSIKRALRIIAPMFEDILLDQQLLSTSHGLSQFVRLIPDENFALLVEKELIALPENSVERWSTFLKIYKSFWSENSGNRKIKHLVEEIQLQLCYPRLDVNVTKGSNHLLKAPFSIHPKTGRVCIVFRPNQVANIKPEHVPSISVLLDDQSPEWKQHKILMQDAVKAFQEQVFVLEKDEAKRRRCTDDLEF